MKFGVLAPLLLAPLAELALGFELQPIQRFLPDHGKRSDKENEYAALNLLSTESFFGPVCLHQASNRSQNARSALGNLTVHMPGKHENLISMEKFHHLVDSTQCTHKSMTLKFSNDKAYDYSRKAWEWVNEEDERTFVLIAGQGHCGWNLNRLPFVVANVLFNDDKKNILITGKVSTWKKVAHTYDLFVGGHPELAKRDWDPSFSLDFNHALPLSSKSFSVGDVTFNYNCEGCGTKGDFDFEFHISTELLIPTGASMTLSPQGVSADFSPSLSLSANFTGTESNEYELGKIPIDGISIPGGVLDLGPEITFSLGYELGPVTGTATVSTGVTASLEDSAELTIDLTSPDVSASGWSPTIETKPLTLDAAISGGVKVYIKAGIQLALEALDTGFDIGLDLQPWAGATLTLASSTGEVCPGDSEHHFGIKAAPSAGISLNVEAAEADDQANPFLSKEIASITMPLDPLCTGFGAPPNAPAHTSSKPTSSRPASTIKPSSFSYIPPPPPMSTLRPIPPPPPAPPMASAPLSSSTPVPPPSISTAPTSSAVIPTASSSVVIPPPVSSSAVPPPPPPPQPNPPSSHSSTPLATPSSYFRRRHFEGARHHHIHA